MALANDDDVIKIDRFAGDLQLSWVYGSHNQAPSNYSLCHVDSRRSFLRAIGLQLGAGHVH
jgi:hypothetical protein